MFPVFIIYDVLDHVKHKLLDFFMEKGGRCGVFWNRTWRETYNRIFAGVTEKGRGDNYTSQKLWTNQTSVKKQ